MKPHSCPSFINLFLHPPAHSDKINMLALGVNLTSLSPQPRANPICPGSQPRPPQALTNVCVGSRDGVSAGPGACRLEPVPDPGVRSGPGPPSRLGLSGSSRSRGFRPFWGWGISVLEAVEAPRPPTGAAVSITTAGGTSRPALGASGTNPASPLAAVLNSSLGSSTLTSGGNGRPNPGSTFSSSDLRFGASGGVRMTWERREYVWIAGVAKQ